MFLYSAIRIMRRPSRALLRLWSRAAGIIDLPPVHPRISESQFIDRSWHETIFATMSSVVTLDEGGRLTCDGRLLPTSGIGTQRHSATSPRAGPLLGIELSHRRRRQPTPPDASALVGDCLMPAECQSVSRRRGKPLDFCV